MSNKFRNIFFFSLNVSCSTLSCKILCACSTAKSCTDPSSVFTALFCWFITIFLLSLLKPIKTKKMIILHKVLIWLVFKLLLGFCKCWLWHDERFASFLNGKEILGSLFALLNQALFSSFLWLFTLLYLHFAIFHFSWLWFFRFGFKKKCIDNLQVELFALDKRCNSLSNVF